GCGITAACFGFPGGKRAFCNRHKLDGQVNLDRVVAGVAPGRSGRSSSGGGGGGGGGGDGRDLTHAEAGGDRADNEAKPCVGTKNGAPAARDCGGGGGGGKSGAGKGEGGGGGGAEGGIAGAGANPAPKPKLSGSGGDGGGGGGGGRTTNNGKKKRKLDAGVPSGGGGISQGLSTCRAKGLASPCPKTRNFGFPGGAREVCGDHQRKGMVN
ncbi:unnamed protein product, partial [Scytosiphon promiscuus]